MTGREQDFLTIALAAAGALVVLATAAKVVIWPVFRAIWAALLSAPQIRDDLAEMKLLLRSDILEKFAAEQSVVKELRLELEALKDEVRILRLAQAGMTKASSS